MVSAVFDVLENSEKLMDFRILIVINKLKVNKLLPVCHLKTVRLRKKEKWARTKFKILSCAKCP